MSDDIEKSISDSLETDTKLLPFMPFLLQDMWALGSSVDDIITMIDLLDLVPEQTKVLDLGCGKGAVSIQIALKYGFKVFGIDVMSAFLEDAVKKAVDNNVSNLCQFIRQDIREYVSVEHKFDIVILASLGGILGSIKNTVSQLRTQVRSGGYMIIDDGYLKEKSSLKRKRYEHYRNHKKTLNELTSFNDLLLKEVNTTDLSLKINDEYLNVIENRGKELVAKHPELKDVIKAYINLQQEECEVIKNQMEGALWLIQKMG